MRTTGWLVVFSFVACGAVWLLATGVLGPRPSVTAAIHRLRRAPRPLVRTEEESGLAVRVGATVRRRHATLAERLAHSWTRPLRLIDRSVDLHVGMLVLGALIGFVVPVVILGTLQAAGLISIEVWVPAGLSLICAATVPVAVHSDAMARSDDVAIDLRHQLGAYLDMVTMLLAGNSGYEGALGEAARAGDGLLFRELRRRMREVSATGRSLVLALELVADDYGIVELDQVAATATLSAAEGAPVARSLTAKCATLRSTLAAEQEAAARVRNDKITPPLVGMALLFMAVIIYPALNLN